MKPEKLATSDELETLRQLLVQQIDEAELLFNTSNNSHELSTSKAALRIVEQLLRRTKKHKNLDVA